MTLANRTKEQRLNLGLTQQEVAAKAGVTQQSFQKIEDGRTRNPRRIIEIAKVLQCKPEWLLFGDASSGSKTTPIDTNRTSKITGHYPLISWVQAGNWSSIEELALFDSKYYPCPVRCSDDTFILEVRGISMEPTFRPGEMIFVDPEAEPLNGKYVVARLDDENEATFKQLIIEGNQKFLKPANPNWPEQLIPINGNCTIIGVVVFVGRMP